MKTGYEKVWMMVLAAMVTVGMVRAADEATEKPSYPANRWVLKDSARTKSKAFCATVYMPATDEFLLWGLPHERFEVETFSVKTGKWTDAKPDYALPGFPRRWRDNVSIHGQRLANRVNFTAKDGIQRPTRSVTFHQLTYDTKRDRVLFFVGGKTFSYDPKTRRWADLKPKQSPIACGSLVWASLCYDPVNDEAVLFGGGMALNLWGGAYTWTYDCEKNTWKRLEQPREEQPPLRCCVQTAFDAKNNVIVLFGGNAQDRLLADTWVYDVKTRLWSERKPELSPPPVSSCGLTYLPEPGLLLMGGDSDDRTWTYDVAANKWTRIKGSLGLSKKDKVSLSTAFMSCAYTPKDDLVMLLGMGRKDRKNIRRTWLYRLDPTTATHPKQAGSKPGAFRYRLGNYPQLERAPEPDREANLKRLKELPVNTMVEAKPPASIGVKTWSTATMDTHRGELIYTGGGHSGYSGNDWAHYSVADNRWRMSWPAKVAPYMWAVSVQAYAWSYGGPWSTHTINRYQYDPQSRLCLYLGSDHRPMNGQSIWLSDKPEEAFTYSSKKHGYIQWLYDPVAKRISSPTLGHPHGHFDKFYGSIGTPHGLYLLNDNGLFHGVIGEGTCVWKKIGPPCPEPSRHQTYSMVYDSKRDRLLQLTGVGHYGFRNAKKLYAKVYAYPLKTGPWELLKTEGESALSRDADYNSKHDTLMILGNRKWHVLDMASLVWQTIDCPMPKAPSKWDSTMKYDPVHDVAVCLLPDKWGPMPVYLFRYDPKTAKYRDKSDE